MHVVPSTLRSGSTFRGIGVRVLLVASGAEANEMGRRLVFLGGQVEIVEEIYTALAEVIDDPTHFGLFVLDCDNPGVGGLEGGQRAVQMLDGLNRRLPVILISKDSKEAHFPEDRLLPTRLRAPLSVQTLRVGYEHALRERLAYRVG